MSISNNLTNRCPRKPRARKAWARPVVVLPALALLFALSMRTGQAEERETWNLETRVPSTTLGYLAVDEVGTIADKLRNTAIVTMMNEPEMKAFLKPIRDVMKELMDASASGPGPSISPVPPMVIDVLKQLEGLSGQLAIALIDISAKTGEPSIVASLDFGDNVGDFITFINRVRLEVDPKGEAFRSTERDGRTWWMIDGGPMPITATTYGSTLVIGTSSELVRKTIAAKAAESLATSESFTKTRGRMAGGDTSLMVYGNVESIMNHVGQRMDPQMRDIANTMGLDTLKAAGFGISFVGDGFRDSFVVYAPNADHGLFSVVRTRPTSLDALRFVPSNAIYYQEASIQLESLLPNIRAMAAQADPSAEEEIAKGLDHLHRVIGVDIEDELIGQLEGSVASYISMPPTGGLFPELVVMLKVRDPAEYEQTIHRFAQGVAGLANEDGDAICRVERRTYRDRPIVLFHMQASQGGEILPFTPTWTFVDDWLLITLVPHSMKEFILRSKETSAGLASNQDFQRLQRKRPKGTGVVTYYDTASIMSLLYDTAIPLLQTAVKPNMMAREMPPLDWSKLPAARTMRPYMRSTCAFSTMDEEGIAVSVQGPAPMMVGYVGLLVGIAIAGPAMARSRAAAKIPGAKPVHPWSSLGPGERLTIMHMTGRNLRIAIDLFRLQHKRLPGTLDELTMTTEDESEPFIEEIPKDAWGRNFVYRIEGRRYSIVSAGADGVAGTQDDVKVYPAPDEKPGK